jgi:hypothetical protein
MTDIHIPAAALEAGARADYERWVYHCTHVDGSRVGDPLEYPTWEQLEDDQRSEALDRARACFNAIVKAWEFHQLEWRNSCTFDGKPIRYSVLILPLPQEKTDG